jgi:molybdopterin-guanine dinucleotide biosynthesis protein A
MGRPKEALRLPDGRTMIGAVIEALGALCRRVVIAGGPRTPAPDDPSVAHINDLRPGQGPLGGIEALLASGLDDEYLVCPCDVPLVTADLLARLTADTTTAAATVFHVEGETVVRPLPARIAADSLPVVRRLLDVGRRAVHDLMREVGAQQVAITSAEATPLAAADTPQDFDAIVRTLRRKPRGRGPGRGSEPPCRTSPPPIDPPTTRSSTGSPRS